MRIARRVSGIFFSVLASALLFATGASAQERDEYGNSVAATTAPDPGGDDIRQTVARISAIDGEVSYARGDAPDDWQAADRNVPVTLGDRLYTGAQGRAELQVHGGSIVRIGVEHRLRRPEHDRRHEAVRGEVRGRLDLPRPARRRRRVRSGHAEHRDHAGEGRRLPRRHRRGRQYARHRAAGSGERRGGRRIGPAFGRRRVASLGHRQSAVRLGVDRRVRRMGSLGRGAPGAHRALGLAPVREPGRLGRRPTSTNTAAGRRSRRTGACGRRRSPSDGSPIASADGSGRTPGAGPGSRRSPGAGRRITTAAGSSTPRAGAGCRWPGPCAS